MFSHVFFSSLLLGEDRGPGHHQCTGEDGANQPGQDNIKQQCPREILRSAHPGESGAGAGGAE